MSGAIKRQNRSPVKRLLALLHRHKWRRLPRKEFLDMGVLE
jgi:hypothetical protein